MRSELRSFASGSAARSAANPASKSAAWICRGDRQAAGIVALQMNRDIADIKSQEGAAEAPRASEEQWRQVFEHSPVMHFLVEATSTTVLSVNAMGASQLGYMASELVGHSALDVVFEEDREFARKNIAACLTTLGQSNSWEVRKVRKDGMVLQVREYGKGIPWSGNQPIVLIASDITGRHLDDLESSRLAAIVSSSDDAIITKTLDGKVTSWNAGATSIFGYEASEMIGQSITRIIPPELHDEERQILARLARGERLQHYETVRIARDGHRVDISLTVSPLISRSGKVVGASKIARDITATKRAEAELQQARIEFARVARVTTLGELTAAIAHEVNQPLTGLVSSGNACLRWLAGEAPDLEAARRSIERMIRDGSRAGEVIGRIRAMVTKSKPQRDSLNINDAIMEVLALLRTEIRRNDISPYTELSNDLSLVWGDRVQLQQVILNLVMNAIEAMSGISQTRRKLLVASVKDGPNGVLVSIRDSGPGFDETAPDRLFEAFYTTKENGMGIGLAVSRTIIQAHGGRLWAMPNAPQGAIFRFTLPTDSEHGS
jgi:PAS domain S-box-containing protein